MCACAPVATPRSTEMARSIYRNVWTAPSPSLEFESMSSPRKSGQKQSPRGGAEDTQRRVGFSPWGSNGELRLDAAPEAVSPQVAVWMHTREDFTQQGPNFVSPVYSGEANRC